MYLLLPITNNINCTYTAITNKTTELCKVLCSVCSVHKEFISYAFNMNSSIESTIGHLQAWSMLARQMSK